MSQKSKKTKLTLPDDEKKEPVSLWDRRVATFLMGLSPHHGSKSALFRSLASSPMYDRNLVAEVFKVIADEELYQEAMKVYNYGCGDCERAMKLLDRAGRMGHLTARFRVAYLHYKGHGVPENHAKAVELLRPLVEAKHGPSLYIGAIIQAHQTNSFPAEDVDVMRREAYVRLRVEARQGDRDAQHWLAQCYMFGLGHIRDFKRARKWYLRAARQGQVWSMERLADIYNQGYGCRQSSTRARRWLMRSLKAGRLGVLHNGDFTSSEDEDAMEAQEDLVVREADDSADEKKKTMAASAV